MEWLNKWLIRHKNVFISLYGIDDFGEDYICIKMYHVKGNDRFSMIPYKKRRQIPSVMDEMYRQLIEEVLQ